MKGRFDMEKGICRDCEFCFLDGGRRVCAGEYYNEDVTDSIDEFKDCYSEGLEAFCRRKDRESIRFVATTLGEIKIDGRKSIFLIDTDGKTIEIKAKKAQEAFRDVVIIKVSDDDYYLDTVFNREMFNGSNYIIIR